MKTKIIPFDLETAKKIQEGLIAGAIKTIGGHDAKLLYAGLDSDQPVVVIIRLEHSEIAVTVSTDGHFYRSKEQNDFDLVLEVADEESRFKPFDRVLVRDDNSCEWCLALYAYYREKTAQHRMVGGACWEQCIPYEGNEHLVGTTLQC